MREALQLGHNYIGTEHILLGIVREGNGVGVQVLQDLGARPAQVRQTVLQLLSSSTAERGEEDFGGSEEGEMRDGPRCPSCGLMLEGALKYRRLIADPVDEHEEPLALLMLFCGRCGAILRTFRQGEGGQWIGESGEPFEAPGD